MSTTWGYLGAKPHSYDSYGCTSWEQSPLMHFSYGCTSLLHVDSEALSLKNCLNGKERERERALARAYVYPLTCGQGSANGSRLPLNQSNVFNVVLFFLRLTALSCSNSAQAHGALGLVECHEVVEVLFLATQLLRWHVAHGRPNSGPNSWTRQRDGRTAAVSSH